MLIHNILHHDINLFSGSRNSIQLEGAGDQLLGDHDQRDDDVVDGDDDGERERRKMVGLLYFLTIPRNPDFKQPWRRQLLRNIVGKGENAGNQHFLLFPQCFLPY